MLASLLKPVDDPRMYEKFALSMGQTSKYEINIIGFSAKNIPGQRDIHFWPVFKFRRLSLQRLLSPLHYWKTLLKVKPELIILNSHDLLLVSCVYKIIFGCKLSYDVRENYKQNIIWSSGLPSFLRFPLAHGVRLKEQLCKRMIIHFFVAEKCYLNECSFITSSFSLLQNKAHKNPPAFPSPLKETSRSKMPTKQRHTAAKRPLRLIYSGTIAESYGIFDCLELLEKWVRAGKEVNLTIIGYCPRQDTLAKVREMIREKPYIQLIGGEAPVPHPSILEALSEADYALISYRLNPSNEHCMPTRIWECLAIQLPMIMKKEHPWLGLLQEHKAGIALDYQHPPLEIPPYPDTSAFYPKAIPESFYWEYEEIKLLSVLERLF